jgi:hypothetical protein
VIIKHIIGILLISSPAIALFGYLIKKEGFFCALKLLCFCLPVFLVVITGAVLITGCTTTQPIIAPCRKPILPPEPHYPIKDLKHGDKPPTVVKAYVATVQLQQDYIGILKHMQPSI